MSAWPANRLWAVAGLAVAALYLALMVHAAPAVTHGILPDNDAYMRLLRIENLLAGGGWFNGAIAQSNWPYGDVINWTRLLDVLAVALAAPLALVKGWP